MRFGDDAEALSPLHQVDATMPAMVVWLGDAGTTVPQGQSLVLRDRLLATGSGAVFVNVPGRRRRERLAGWMGRGATAH